MALGKRREFEVFTLSFLDCICCGFGAIILLLVLTDIGQPIVIERSEKDLQRADRRPAAPAVRAARRNRRAQSRAAGPHQGARRRTAEGARRSPATSQDPRRVQGQQGRSRGHQHRRDRARGRAPDADRRDAAPAQERAAKRSERARRRRHPGRQRMHHLRDRHLGQHAGRQLGERPERHEGNPRHLSQGEGHADPRRRGQADVREHQGPVAAGHARAARARSCRPWSTGSRSAIRARSKASAPRCRAGGRPTRRSACMSSATISPARPMEAALAAVRKYNPSTGRAATDPHPRHRHAGGRQFAAVYQCSVFLL